MTQILQMLTPDEVAGHLRVHVDEVYRLLNRGELAGINIGQGKLRPRWRVDHASLERFKLRLMNHGSDQPVSRSQRPKDYEEIL